MEPNTAPPQALDGSVVDEVGLSPSATRIVQSHYSNADDGSGGESWSRIAIAIHGCAFALGAIWMASSMARNDNMTTEAFLVVVGSTFLLLAPYVVVRWERIFEVFSAAVRADPTVDTAAIARLNTALERIGRIRFLIIAYPVVLIAVAFLGADEPLLVQLGLPTSGIAYWIALAILCLGGVSAGLGTLGAVVTLFSTLLVTRRRTDFAPYAGTTSRSSRRLADFCFSTALYFGSAAAVIVPGLCAAAWAAEGAARVALMGAVALILALTAALLAVPAAVLSRRGEDERVAYLDGLSVKIDSLADLAVDQSRALSEDDYFRLRALLELRSHVVSHSIGPSSIDLVKRIPVAVLLPGASVAASWLSLVIS